MCKLCDERIPQSHSASRRDFLKGTAATAAFAASPNLFSAHPAAADGGDPPEDSGRPGRRYIIRGGSVMSMDPKVGDFLQADVLIEGKKIVAVGPNLQAGGATPIEVSLMDRTTVETVIVAGKIRKWKGSLLDVNLDKLRSDLEPSRNCVFHA